MLEQTGYGCSKLAIIRTDWFLLEQIDRADWLSTERFANDYDASFENSGSTIAL